MLMTTPIGSENLALTVKVKKKISFEINRKSQLQKVVVSLATTQVDTMDELKDLLGFKCRGTVLRWIFDQLEQEKHLSRWTLEMLEDKSKLHAMLESQRRIK